MGRSQTYNDETDHAGWLVRCTGCGFRRRNPIPDYCQRCGAPLEVELDYGEDLQAERLFDGCITDLWKYGSLYPVSLSHSVDLSLVLPANIREMRVGDAGIEPATSAV